MFTSQWSLSICLSYLDNKADMKKVIKLLKNIHKKSSLVLLYLDHKIKWDDLKYKFSLQLCQKLFKLQKNTKPSNSSSFSIFVSGPKVNLKVVSPIYN